MKTVRRPTLFSLILITSVFLLDANAQKPDPGEPQGESFIADFVKRKSNLAQVDPDVRLICERDPCEIHTDFDGDGAKDFVVQIMDSKSFKPGIAIFRSDKAPEIFGAGRNNLLLEKELIKLRELNSETQWAPVEPEKTKNLSNRVNTNSNAILIGNQLLLYWDDGRFQVINDIAIAE